jgi:hypothetical protein
MKILDKSQISLLDFASNFVYKRKLLKGVMNNLG